MEKRDGATAPVIDIYARLNVARNGETVQVDDQVEMGDEAIERRGGVVGKVFKDNSRSAWKPNVVRKQWNEPPRLCQRLVRLGARLVETGAVVRVEGFEDGWW